jgi:hypothetical protein
VYAGSGQLNIVLIAPLALVGAVIGDNLLGWKRDSPFLQWDAPFAKKRLALLAHVQPRRLDGFRSPRSYCASARAARPANEGGGE